MPENQDISKLPPNELDQLVTQAVESILKRDRERGLPSGSEFIGKTIVGSQPPRLITAENLKDDLTEHLRALIKDSRTTGFVRVQGKEVVLFNRPTNTALILRTQGGPSTAFTSTDPKWLEQERDRWAEKLSSGSTLYDQSLNPLLARKNDSIIAEYGNGGLANIELAHRTRLEEIETKTRTIKAIIQPSIDEATSPGTQGFYNAKERNFTFYNERNQTLIVIGYEKEGGRLNYRDAELKSFSNSDNGISDFLRRAEQSEALNGNLKIEEGGLPAFNQTTRKTNITIPNSLSEQKTTVTLSQNLSFGQTIKNPFETIGTITNPSRLLTTSLPSNRTLNSPYNIFGSNTGSMFNPRQYDAPRTFERTFGLFDNVDDNDKIDPTQITRNPNRFSQFGEKVDNIILGQRQPFAMPDSPDIFKSGSTLDEMISQTRIRKTPEFAFRIGETLVESNFLQSPKVQRTISGASNFFQARSTIFETRGFKAGKLMWDGFGTIKALSEITGLNDALFEKSAESKTFGNGFLNNTGNYGIKALNTTDDLLGPIPVAGDVSSVLSKGAWLIGWKPSQQIALETLNSYNTKIETHEQKFARWKEFTGSIPTTLLIGIVPGSPDKGMDNLAKNLTEFMERYPDARRGDVIKVFWEDHKDILKELTREKPNWAYVDNFVRNTPMNDIRESYAQYAQENSVGYFTQAPIFGDQYKVPQAGLFYLSGDYLNTIPGKVTLDKEAMINGFAKHYEDYLNNPLMKSYLDQYVLDQNKDTGNILNASSLLLLSPKEREEYERVRALERTQDITAGTQAARSFAIEKVNEIEQNLSKLYKDLKTNVDTCIEQFANGINVEYRRMIENAKLAAIQIEKFDQSIAACSDPATAELLKKNRQEWVDWGSSKYYNKFVEDSKKWLKDSIQSQVDYYTKNRDAMLFGSTGNTGEKGLGLQGSLNSFNHSQAPIRPLSFDITPFIKEESPMTYQIDTLVQQMQTVSQSNQPTAQSQSTIYTTTVKGLTPGLPQFDYDQGLTVNNERMALVFQKSANPDPNNVIQVDSKDPEALRSENQTFMNNTNTLYRYAA